MKRLFIAAGLAVSLITPVTASPVPANISEAFIKTATVTFEDTNGNKIMLNSSLAQAGKSSVSSVSAGKYIVTAEKSPYKNSSAGEQENKTVEAISYDSVAIQKQNSIKLTEKTQ